MTLSFRRSCCSAKFANGHFELPSIWAALHLLRFHLEVVSIEMIARAPT